MEEFCKKCGNKIRKDFKFCTKCGNEITSSTITKKMSKKVKITYILILIIICPMIFIVTYSSLKKYKEIKAIKENLTNVKYDKIEVTSKKCNGNCNGSCDGTCFSYQKLDNCKKYDIEIYMNKKDVVHAVYEIFDDNTIRENTINSNVNEYLKIKKIIDEDFVYKELEYYPYETDVYLDEELAEIDTNFLISTENFCSKIEDDTYIYFIFKDKYRNLSYEMQCFKNNEDITIDFRLHNYSRFYRIKIDENIDYKNELNKLKKRMNSPMEPYYD